MKALMILMHVMHLPNFYGGSTSCFDVKPSEDEPKHFHVHLHLKLGNLKFKLAKWSKSCVITNKEHYLHNRSQIL